jgi:hypothetical protein
MAIAAPLLGQTSESFEESELINFYLFDNVEYIEYRFTTITKQILMRGYEGSSWQV